MGYTITEKILLAHTDKKRITPDDFIFARVDMALANDITAPLAIEEFRRAGFKSVFDKSKVALVLDHFTPNKDMKSAQQCKFVRDFAIEKGVKNFFEGGCAGIEHALLPEMGLVSPADVVVGADSHTCTYGALGAFSTGVGSSDLAAVMAKGYCWFRVPRSMKFIYRGKPKRWVGGKDLILYTIGDIGVDGALYKTMEFTGDAVKQLPMDDRFTMCNMAIEAGGKSGIVEPDEITRKYVKEHQNTSHQSTRKKLVRRCASALAHNLKSDKDANYCEVREYDVSKLEPQVALPHLPSNAKPVSKVGKINIDQSVIGSCTNGRISDLRIAASVLKGKKVNSRVRTVVIPATPSVYMKAVDEGLVEIFIKAGAVVSPPTCGPCLGGHMGILAEGERAISTTNRNFVGRMGHPKSEVYLSNPAVAAASAIKGRIAHPDEI